MGSPPPEDAPEPADQDQQTASASFAASPSGVELCGFALPIDLAFSFNLNFALPSLDFSFPPSLDFLLALSCDIDKKIDAPDGGGREGTLGLDDDAEFDTPD